MYVEKPFRAACLSRPTNGYIQGRNHVSALCVGRHLPRASLLKCISLPIQGRNPIHVTSVASHLHSVPLWLCINAITLGRDPTSVRYATGALCPRHCSILIRRVMTRHVFFTCENDYCSLKSYYAELNIYIWTLIAWLIAVSPFMRFPLLSTQWSDVCKIHEWYNSIMLTYFYFTGFHTIKTLICDWSYFFRTNACQFLPYHSIFPISLKQSV